jgi:hypothetical protein
MKCQHPSKSGGTDAVSTPCHPMSHYLYVAGVKHVDFFSLDVEGAELKVLLTIDSQQTTVDVFMVELDEHDPKKNYEIRQLLFNIGYAECLNLIPRSGVFVKSTSPHVCPGANTTVPSPQGVPHPPPKGPSFFSIPNW